eukprot:1192065-Prorocentrum_minimum.AAC.2
MEIHGEWYIKHDVSIPCYDARHNSYQLLAALGVLLYPIGIPVLFYGLLLRCGRRLHRAGGGHPLDPLTNSLQGSVYVDHEPPRDSGHGCRTRKTTRARGSSRESQHETNNHARPSFAPRRAASFAAPAHHNDPRRWRVCPYKP